MDLTKDFSEFINRARKVLDNMDDSVGEGIHLDESDEFAKPHVDNLMRAVMAGLMSLELIAKLGTICEKED